MAFEAFMSAHGRGASAAQATGFGHLLSIAVHATPAALVLVLAAASSHPKPRTTLASTERTVPVRVSLRLVQPRRQALVGSTAAIAGDDASDRDAFSASTPRVAHARRAKPHAAAVAHEALVASSELPSSVEVPASGAPVVPPPGEGPAAADVDTEGAPTEPALPASPFGGAGGGGPSFGAGVALVSVTRPPPRPRDPYYVPASVAKGLRIFESFPHLPSSLQKKGARYVALVDICVSSQGAVSTVAFKEASAPALDEALVESIRTWRYTPWMVDGVPVSFCHPLRITYVRQ